MWPAGVWVMSPGTCVIPACSGHWLSLSHVLSLCRCVQAGSSIELVFAGSNIPRHSAAFYLNCDIHLHRLRGALSIREVRCLSTPLNVFIPQTLALRADCVFFCPREPSALESMPLTFLIAMMRNMKMCPEVAFRRLRLIKCTYPSPLR